jgi:hypothetical protein
VPAHPATEPASAIPASNAASRASLVVMKTIFTHG